METKGLRALHVGVFAAWPCLPTCHSSSTAICVPSQGSLGKLQQTFYLGTREGRSLITEAKAVFTNGLKGSFLTQRNSQREPRGTAPGKGRHGIIQRTRRILKG